MSSPESQLTSLQAILTELTDVIMTERRALQLRDSATLAETADAKLALVEQVSTYNLDAIKDQISTLPDHERQHCDTLHSSVVKSAQAVRDSNLVNGMIVHRTQQSTGELLRILSGKPRNGLYGTTGTPVAGRETPAATIAKA